MSNVTEIHPPWIYTLTRTTEDRSVARPAIPTVPINGVTLSSELTGIDGSLHGGLRPAPGFIMVHELDFYDDDNHDETSRVTKNGFFPFNSRVDADGYAYGFVYRVQRAPAGTPDSSTGDAPLADVFLDLWNSKVDTDTFGVRALKIMDGVSVTAQMDLAVFGRHVYVFIEGQSPTHFYVRRVSEGVYAIKIDNTPGPGKRPTLASFEDGDFSDVAQGTLPNTIIDAPNRPAIGQLWLYPNLPSVTGLFSQQFADSTASTLSSGVSEGSYFQDRDARMLEPGDYVFCYQLLNSQTGLRSALSDIAQVRREDFVITLPAPGVSSGPSDTMTVERDMFAALEIVYDSDDYDQLIIMRSVKAQDAGGTLATAIAQVEAIIDLEDYHTDLNGGPGSQESTASTLSSSGATESRFPITGPLRHALIFYTLEDKQLMWQDFYDDKAFFDETMPFGGAAMFHDNSMFVSKIKNQPASTNDEVRRQDATRGLGEMRYSSVFQLSPELFSPSNRFVPSIPSSEIIRFEKAGGNIIGFSLDRLYHIRRESVAVKTLEMHTGYGTVNNQAVDEVSSLIYYVTPKGIKSIGADGQLDDVRVFDSILLRDWSMSLSDISVACDPLMSTLFITNAAEERQLLIWFNTGISSELADVPFLEGRRGSWPRNPTDLMDNLTERALFVQNVPYEDGDVVPTTPMKPRVFIYDMHRQKVIDGSAVDDGLPRIALLDPTADLRFDVLATGALATTGVLTVDVANANLGSRLEGCKLYVLDASDPDLIGELATIKWARSNGTIQLRDFDALVGLKAGDRVGISPVRVRWVGHNLGMLAATGEQFAASSYIQRKIVSSVGCAFSDVSGPAADADSSDAKFTALVFRGDSDTPLATAHVRDSGGESSLVPSVVEGESQVNAAFPDSGSSRLAKTGVGGTSLSPGIETFCPDLDYRLLQVSVRGTITPSTRSRQ